MRELGAPTNGPPRINEEKQYWSNILNKLPEEESLKVVLDNLPRSRRLCKQIPRKGFIFNLLRITLKTTPAELRKKLIEGSEHTSTHINGIRKESKS